jgi:transcriptional regulator of acetoin/glycerol metabolism
MGKHIETVPAAAMQKLMNWHWPGNVRELENLVERSVILSHNGVLAVSPPERKGGAIDAAAVVGQHEEHERIVSALRETRGRVSGPRGAALRLGLKRSTLLDRMKKLGISARDV